MDSLVNILCERRIFAAAFNDTRLKAQIPLVSEVMFREHEMKSANSELFGYLMLKDEQRITTAHQHKIFPQLFSYTAHLQPPRPTPSNLPNSSRHLHKWD